MQILLIEDNPGDARLISEMLSEVGGFDLEYVDKIQDAIDRLGKQSFDIVLMDLNLPDSRGIASMTKVHDASPGMPIVVMTGIADEASGVKALRQGAQDYLVKGQVYSAILVRSLRHAIEHQRIQDELREALNQSDLKANEISSLYESVKAILKYEKFEESARFIFELCKKIIGARAGYIALSNADGSQNEVVFLDPGGLECTVDESLPMPIRGMRGEAYRKRKTIYSNDFQKTGWSQFLPPGHVELDNVLLAPLLIEGKAVGLLGLSHKEGGFDDEDARIATTFAEIASVALSKNRLLESLKTSEERFRSVAETASDAIITIDSGGRVVFWNDAAEMIFGLSERKALGKSLDAIIPERFRIGHSRGTKRVISKGVTKLIGRTTQVVGLRKDGSEFPLELSLSMWKASGETFFTSIVRDITERKKTEEERERLNLEVQTAYERQRDISQTLQKAFEPATPPKLPGIDLSHIYQSATEEAFVGGDFYDFIELGDIMAILVGDVSGKGIEASAQQLATRLYTRNLLHQGVPMNYILEHLNDELYNETAASKFVTLLFMLLSPGGELTWSSAGHPPPTLYNASKDAAETLPVISGPPLGVKDKIFYESRMIKLEKEDILLAYTDGLTEVHCDGELFGEGRIQSHLERNQKKTSKKIVEGLLKEVLKFGKGKLKDDLAMLCLKKKS